MQTHEHAPNVADPPEGESDTVHSVFEHYESWRDEQPREHDPHHRSMPEPVFPPALFESFPLTLPRRDVP